MRVNARGDELGPGGQIVRTRNQVLKDRERIHTMVPTDEPVYASLEEALAAQAEADANDPAMMDNLETPEPVTTETDPEPVVEVTAPAATSVRGNLASAVTKQSTVKTPVTRNTRQTGLKRI
jgi:hypothetical protein